MIVAAPGGHDAGLHGEATRGADRVLVAEAEVGERRAGGDAELGLDEVDAGDLLGDGVLDLDARVALDEEVLAGLGDDEELDGAGVDVARRRGPARRRSSRMRSRSAGSRPGAGATSTTFWLRSCTEQSRSWRWTTWPWASARICTSMWRGRSTSRSTNSAPSPNAAVASLRHRSNASAIVAGPAHGAHAPPAAAGRRLEHHRVADLARRLGRVVGRRHRARRAGHDRDAERAGQLRGPGPCRRTGRAPSGGRPDEREAGRRAALGEGGVLGQEAVAGVDAVAAVGRRATSTSASTSR